MTVRSAARSASSNEEGAEDLTQSIWAELYGLRVREDGRPAGKLAYYSGRGSLAGWLRAVVAQLAIDQHRKQSRLVQTDEDSDFDRIIQQGQDENEWSGHGGSVNPELEISKKLAGAALDVYWPEPPPADFPLLGLENVLLTPHLAARTTTAMENMSWVVRDIVEVLEGRKPKYPAP